MTSIAIRCRSLVKRYGKQTAVNAIDLDVVTGECFGLLGPNGAGKTTTVEILEGLNQPDSGTVTLFDIAWRSGRDQELRERIGVQLQETQLGDKLRVVEVFELFRSFYREGHSVDELIGVLDLGMERDKYYSKLSGGQKQRVALGCALVGKPDLLFLDEPTTGLDPRARRAIWGVVERFRAEGGTVLITTHYMEEATALCDRIAIMDHGKIIALDTPRALVDGLGLVQFVEFEASAALDEAALARRRRRRLGRETARALPVAHRSEPRGAPRRARRARASERRAGGAQHAPGDARRRLLAAYRARARKPSRLRDAGANGGSDGVVSAERRRHPLWELTKTRLREFLREPAALFWVFGFPLLMAIGLGVAFRSRPPELPRVGVVATTTAGDVPDGARALLSSKRLRAEALRAEAARRALAAGKIDLVVEWDARRARVSLRSRRTSAARSRGSSRAKSCSRQPGVAMP